MDLMPSVTIVAVFAPTYTPEYRIYVEVVNLSQLYITMGFGRLLKPQSMSLINPVIG